MKKLFRSPRVKAVTGFWSLSLRVNNIQRLLAYLLIFFVPTQFGRHFWPEFSFIKGIRIDYLSPILYFTDILILLIFIFWIFSKKKFPHFAKASRGKQISIIVFIAGLIFGIILSKSPQAGIYGLLKLLEFVFLGFYIAHNIKKLKLEKILLMFSIGIIFESFLSIAQYFNHGSFQGIFYFFGERFFNPETLGIANASLGGELFLRPYGTFSHPNVLAGFLVIAMTMIILNIKNQISKMRKSFYLFTILIGTAAIFLTLSRVATLLWLIVICSWFMVQVYTKLKTKFSIFYILLSILALILIGWVFFTPPLHTRFTELRLIDESIVQRESLIQSSITMIKDNPVFGVGLNNFLVNLPTREIIQPVHNIFLLVTSETGLIGLGFFIWFIFKTFSRITNQELRIKEKSMIPNNAYAFRGKHNSLSIILSLILILGMFDHYFLTLQQGQLLFAVILGICWADPETASDAVK